MIRINQIKVSPEISMDEEKLNDELMQKIRKSLKLNSGAGFTFKIIKKSIDSRKKPDIFIVYSVDVFIYDISNNIDKENKLLKKINNNNIMLSKTVEYSVPENVRSKSRPSPVIVGFGPAGMFCALMLARAGYKPIVIERGEPVEKRIKTVEKFWKDGVLTPDSNIQFGEGGAGTFSDGKLNTQVKEVYGRISKVLDIFVEHGADKAISYEAKPHIGTDRLVHIVKNIREEILSLGGKIFFNTLMKDIDIKDNKVCGLFVEYARVTSEDWCHEADNSLTDNIQIDISGNGYIACDTVVLSIGHSARDTFYTLEKKITMEQKPFAVGLRIEHPQELINIHEFGDGKYMNYMPASYKLTHKASNGRGIYSFCMCPGGYVVNASSEDGMLAVNGMSYSKRNSSNANSALIVTVDEKDFGSSDVLAGIEFQRRLERSAYELCDGKIPVQLFGDFEENAATSKEKLETNPVKPQIKGKFAPANIRAILPDGISQALIEGVHSFDRQISGFADAHAVFSGIESRTSSPVRIVRESDLQAVGINGLYPCGEGAGYAGGITSAAVDGIKVYEAIVTKI